MFDPSTDHPKQSPETPSSNEQELSKYEQSRQELDSKQKTETEQVGKTLAKNKSETVSTAASARADLLASMPLAPTPETPAPAASPNSTNKKSFGDQIKEFFGKFTAGLGPIGEKISSFFKNIFNKNSTSPATGLESANSTNTTLDNKPAATLPPSPSNQLEKTNLDLANDGTQGLNGEALLNNEKFKARTEQIATKLGCSLDDLYAIFKMESGANPQAVNPVSKATGLIQWMPKYAPQFGTTTAELAKMTGLQQLDYVEKFFSRYFGKLHTFADLYRAVFWPAAIGKGPDYIFQTSAQSAELIAKQNPGIAKAAGRPDGFIDNAGFEKYANKFAPKNQKIA
ncbi:MAG: transglycosylase SLT domain-containing protein [Candidatus Altimarinota bacterium]